ncbi:MAG: 16S rRNA (cytidine(1402)-2'-O)-methyltransferase [Planctomycetota bacterium]
MNTGILYLVSTPIGNLEDITLRALRVLKEVDLIACEDTRLTANLLNHYDIKKPLISYFEPAWRSGRHNKDKQGQLLIDKLLAGSSIALVSNAGTPLISDPGYELVNLCVEHNILVRVIPGASAAVSALAISGLPTDKFIFEGFLPKKPSKRRKRLQDISSETRTIVIYESPYRILKTLSELKDILGERRIVLAREMTKFYEEVIRGNIEDVIQHLGCKKIKGEITLIIQGSFD